MLERLTALNTNANNKIMQFVFVFYELKRYFRIWRNQHVEQTCLNELSKEIKCFSFPLKCKEYVINFNDIQNPLMPAILLNEHNDLNKNIAGNIDQHS